MKVLDLFVSQPIVLRLGWTLFHFVWQATLVALIVAIILQCLKKQAASIRYSLASLSLVFIVVMGVITFTQVSVSRPLPGAVYQPALSLVQAEKPSQTVNSTEIQPTSANTEPTFSWPVFRKRCISLAEPALPYAVIGWLVGVLTLSLMHVGGWTRLRRIRQQVTRPISPELEQTARDIAHRLGVHKAFKVLESGLVQVPTAIGHMKPVILLPASALTGLSFEQIEIILAHELAHIKRHDYLINLFQTAIETLGFYHPAIWWLSHIIRLERENCCDDRVVQAFSNPVQYANALADLAKIRSRQIDLAMAANGSILVHRIERLLSMDGQEHRRPTWLASILSLILIMAIAIQTAVAFAAKDRRQRPASDDVAATFNEWVNAIVDNDTKTFEIIAHKMTMHRRAGYNQAAIAERFQGRGQELMEAYDGFDRLKIVSMENKGDHFDVLTSPVKDPRGVSGRLSIGILTKTKPFYVSGVVRFIAKTGTSYSVPQKVLTRVYYLIAPNNFPLIERLPDSSGHISPNALTTFREAIKTLSNVKVFASPQVINLSGSLSTMKIEGNENYTFETSVLSKVRGDRTTIVMDYEYDVLFEGESIYGQDQATMPSEHAIYTKAHTFSEKNEALYILIQSTALKSPQRETEPLQVSSRTTEFNRDKSRSDEEKERANDESLSGQSERVVSFSDNRSIGTLKLRDWDAFDVHISEWEEWREAAGRVTVPEGKALGLFLSMEACSDLSVLESLGGDDLQLLNLPFVQLDAEELEHLAGLTGLQELRLAGVEFNDSNAALARIKRLPSLRRLSLMHHELTERGLAHVGEMTSLEDLILFNATVDDEGLAHLKELKALRGLDLTETSISDEGLAYLAGMESLRTLYLGDARRITDDGLVHVGRLRSLERISLRGVGITDAGLDHLRELTSLTYLRIDSNPTITGEGLKHLAGLTRLKDLNIQSTGVGNEGLAHLKNFIVLEKLNIANTHVDDAGLAHLAQLPALKSLRLPDGITDQGLAHLHACAQLEELDLAAQSVTADGLRQLAQIPRLRILRLSKLHDGALAALSDLSSLEQIHLWASPFSQNTDHGPERISISDDGLAHLRGLSNLYSLDIQNSQRITDDGLAYLSDLPAIEDLLLYNVPVGDAGIAHLAGLTSLTKLGLSTTKVTDAGLSHLAGLTSLKNLQLRRTSVTDEGMAELAGLTALEFLGLGETKVTEAGIARLRGLPSLISISGLVERQLGNRGALRLKPGDPAPAFSIKTVDGKSLRLEDFRGKVVLLDFWATWCGPCVVAMPELQALYDEYSKDGRFTIIGLSLDDNVSTAKWFARDKGLSWPQGYAGRWSKSGVRSDYGIEGIPAYFLIGPDGTILANQSGGLSQIKTATEVALRPN